MCLGKPIKTPLRRNVDSLLSLLWATCTNIMLIIRGDQAALGGLPLKIKCKYFKTFFSDVKNNKHFSILDCKLYLSNSFWEWDTGYVHWNAFAP